MDSLDRRHLFVTPCERQKRWGVLWCRNIGEMGLEEDWKSRRKMGIERYSSYRRGEERTRRGKKVSQKERSMDVRGEKRGFCTFEFVSQRE
jgi:hypothetical protein